jgi:hypothetical protein
MKNWLYYKGNDHQRAFPKWLGMARFYSKTDEILLLPIPFNWLVVGFDIALYELRKGRVLRCPHCKKAI